MQGDDQESMDTVIPAKAGTQSFQHLIWVTAFAGMTIFFESSISATDAL
jgi:hypothetical protein